MAAGVFEVHKQLMEKPHFLSRSDHGQFLVNGMQYLQSLIGFCQKYTETRIHTSSLLDGDGEKSRQGRGIEQEEERAATPGYVSECVTVVTSEAL